MGLDYSVRSHWLVCVLQVFSCHAAEEVLEQFRNRFIADMDAKTVVMELLNMDVIDEGVKNRIFREDSTKLQNEILHDCLKKRCTDNALRVVCDVIIGGSGNPRMRALGQDIKKRLVAGKGSVCFHASMHVRVCTVTDQVCAVRQWKCPYTFVTLGGPQKIQKEPSWNS